MNQVLENTIHWILFLLGVSFVFVGACWAIDDPGYESILSFIGGISMFIVDFVLTMRWKHMHSLGSRPSKRKLREEANRLGISNIGGLSRDIMHKTIIAENVRLQKALLRQNYAKFAIVALLSSSLLLIYAERQHLFRKPENTPVDVEVQWFAPKDGTDQIIDPQDLKLSVAPEDILRDRLVLPIKLAIRNKEASRLQAVNVELLYPTWVNPVSGGTRKLSRDDKTQVFVHNVGDLDPTEYFSPLVAQETVEIPFWFSKGSFILFSKAKLPILMHYVLGQDVFGSAKLNFRMNVHSAGRPVTRGKLSITPKFGLKFFTDLDESKPSEILPDDRAFFARSFDSSNLVDSWDAPYKFKGLSASIGYREFKIGSCKVQVLEVDGIRRRVMVDENGDKNLDYALWDEGSDGVPDQKLLWGQAWPMLTWKREWAESPDESQLPDYSGLQPPGMNSKISSPE